MTLELCKIKISNDLVAVGEDVQVVSADFASYMNFWPAFFHLFVHHFCFCPCCVFRSAVFPPIHLSFSLPVSCCSFAGKDSAAAG